MGPYPEVASDVNERYRYQDEDVSMPRASNVYEDLIEVVHALDHARMQRAEAHDKLNVARRNVEHADKMLDGVLTRYNELTSQIREL